MANQQHPDVSSSTDTYCYPVCDHDCDNLRHEPDFIPSMEPIFRRFNPNERCHCFFKFLQCAVKLVRKICEDTRRREIYSDTFVCLIKSLYKPAIRNYRRCLAEHENTPPHSFCTRCFKDFSEETLTTIHCYNIIHMERVPVKLCKFFISFIDIICRCQDGCLEVVV